MNRHYLTLGLNKLYCTELNIWFYLYFSYEYPSQEAGNLSNISHEFLTKVCSENRVNAKDDRHSQFTLPGKFQMNKKSGEQIEQLRREYQQQHEDRKKRYPVDDMEERRIQEYERQVRTKIIISSASTLTLLLPVITVRPMHHIVYPTVYNLIGMVVYRWAQFDGSCKYSTMQLENLLHNNNKNNTFCICQKEN